MEGKIDILVDTLFIQRDTGHVSICLKLKNAVLSPYFPCIRERMSWEGKDKVILKKYKEKWG